MLTLCACVAMQNESQKRRWKHLLLLVIRLGGHRVPVSITGQFRALPGEAPSFTLSVSVSAVCWRLAEPHREMKIGKLLAPPVPRPTKEPSLLLEDKIPTSNHRKRCGALGRPYGGNNI